MAVILIKMFNYQKWETFVSDIFKYIELYFKIKNIINRFINREYIQKILFV